MVVWFAPNLVKTPEMVKFYGQEDFEALYAMSAFFGGTAIDQTGTLKWPFPVNLSTDQSLAVQPRAVSACMDERAQQIWAESSDPVAVLCAGDCDSVPVVAALIKHAPSPERVIVRYTASGYKRYPLLFESLIPGTGAVLEYRQGLPLIGESPVRYCDGRAGDDFQAAYQASILGRITSLISKQAVESLIDHVAQAGGGNGRRVAAARRGIDRWARATPFPITDSWSFLVALFRLCLNQYDAWTGVMMEKNSANAYQNRLPFFDSPVFTSASARIAKRERTPSADDEAVDLREYALSFFGDRDWFDSERPISLYYAYQTGKLHSHWLDNEGKSHPYTEFPLSV